jgi:nicotinamidase-related amidase
VLSTVRHAGDLDYRLVVVRDCCADPDAEVHAMLLDIEHREASGRRHHGGARRRAAWQVFMNERER